METQNYTPPETTYMSNAEINDIIRGAIGSIYNAGRIPRDY